MVFAGAADQAHTGCAAGHHSGAAARGRPDGQPTKPFPVPPTPPPPFQAAVLDPDVVTLEIIVEAQAPAHDTGNPARWRTAATFSQSRRPRRHFPRRLYVADSFPGHPTARWAERYRHPSALRFSRLRCRTSATRRCPLPLLRRCCPSPQARNIRLRLRGLGKTDANDGYFGSSVARTGLIADIKVRYEADAEPEILLPANIDQQLQAFYLRNVDQTAAQAGLLLSVGQALATSSEGFYLQDLKNISRLSLLLLHRHLSSLLRRCSFL